MIWQPGQKLRNGAYEIEAELGRGGYGITYRAWNSGLKQHIVVKSPHRHLKNDRGLVDYIDRFRREGENLARLFKNKKCPNIVQVFDCYDEGDNPCLLMEFLDGQTLECLIERKGAIAEEEVISYIVPIAEALAMVHELGISHRDASPANIMIQPDGTPVLIDFGIALEIQPPATTSVAGFGGHTDYAPYEQLRKQEGARSPKVDIYCLAATLYYAVTGQKPSGAIDRKVDILEGKDSLIPPQTIAPHLSDRISHAILAGMEMDPDDRPATMKDWIKLLTTDDGLLSQITAPTLESLPLQRLEFPTIVINEKAEIIAKPKCSVQAFDEILNEDLALKMIVIPGGSFMMGSPDNELNSYNDEKPQHLVTVPSFAIAQTLITQDQWKAIAALPKVKRKLNPSPSYYSGENLPVERVNWFEAVEFCDRLTRLTRKPYRLPSEAEWEYACRAGTTTAFNIGPTIATDFANYRGVDDVRADVTYSGSYGDGPKGVYRGKTTDVQSFPPNRNGLYDMHGNLWEWCSDHWHSGYENAPIDGSIWLDEDADENGDRIIRGGSWYFSPQDCRSAFRSYNAPDNRFNAIGFRLVLPVLAPSTL